MVLNRFGSKLAFSWSSCGSDSSLTGSSGSISDGCFFGYWTWVANLCIPGPGLSVTSIVFSISCTFVICPWNPSILSSNTSMLDIFAFPCSDISFSMHYSARVRLSFRAFLNFWCSSKLSTVKLSRSSYAAYFSLFFEMSRTFYISFFNSAVKSLPLFDLDWDCDMADDNWLADIV